MNTMEVAISAGSDKERHKIVDLVADAAVTVKASLVETPSLQAERKKVIDVGTFVIVLLQTVAAVANGLVANAIYDKIKAASQAPDRVHKRSTETEVEIIDEQSGARIIVRQLRREDPEIASS